MDKYGPPQNGNNASAQFDLSDSTYDIGSSGAESSLSSYSFGTGDLLEFSSLDGYSQSVGGSLDFSSGTSYTQKTFSRLGIGTLDFTSLETYVQDTVGQAVGSLDIDTLLGYTLYSIDGVVGSLDFTSNTFEEHSYSQQQGGVTDLDIRFSFDLYVRGTRVRRVFIGGSEADPVYISGKEYMRQ